MNRPINGLLQNQCCFIAPGLGERVLHVIEQRFETIVQTPQGFPKIRGEFRQALVQTFPYIVIYRLVGSTIEVHAVFQANREPAIWRKRIADQ